MAKENIAFLVNLRKNTITGSKMEGKYYPEAETREALTTKGFARHVSEHGGMVTYEFMQLVTKCLTLCMTILSVTTIFYPIISEETVLQAKPQSH